MKDLAMMMLALSRFCRQHNIQMPYSLEVRFTSEEDARRFERGLKANYDASIASLKPDLSGIDRICSTPLRIAHADHEGKPVRI